MKPLPTVCLALLLAHSAGRIALAQAAPNPPPADLPAQARPVQVSPAQNSSSPTKPLRLRPPMSPEAVRQSRLPLVNGMPYDQPSTRDLALYYVHDTYLLPGFERSTLRALYGEARGKPTGWGQDFAGFSQRFGSAVAITSINGTMRLCFELALHEDLRYIPCPSCKWKRKIINALLAEFTARRGEDGHRAFTLSPTIADFSGPIIAHSIWYPNGPDPFAGVVATRVVVLTRVGSHLMDEAIAAWHFKHAQR